MQKDLNNNSPHEAIDFIQNSSWKIGLIITIKNFQYETKEVKHLRILLDFCTKSENISNRTFVLNRKIDCKKNHSRRKKKKKERRKK